jgi:hypothetical protein
VVEMCGWDVGRGQWVTVEKALVCVGGIIGFGVWCCVEKRCYYRLMFQTDRYGN